MPSQIECTKSEAEDLASAIAQFACFQRGTTRVQFGDTTPIVDTILGHRNSPRAGEPHTVPKSGLIRASDEVVLAMKREEGKHIFKCGCGYHTNRKHALQVHLERERNPECAERPGRGEGMRYASPVCEHRAIDWSSLQKHLRVYHQWMERRRVCVAPPGGGRGYVALEWWYVQQECNANVKS